LDNRRLEKILIIKPSSLGDIIHALPVAAAIKAALPDGRIDWVAGKGYGEILEGNPAINRIITFDRGMLGGKGRAGRLSDFVRELRGERYDIVIDLMGLLRSALMAFACRADRRIGFANAREGAPWFYTEKVAVPAAVTHAVDRYMLVLSNMGIKPVGVTGFGIRIDEKDFAQADGLLKGIGIGPGEPFIAIAPSARWTTKRWPAEKFIKLAGRLQAEKGVKCVFLGSSEDSAILAGHGRDTSVADSALFGSTSLKGLAAILKKARLLVTNDSGPMHVAAAVGTPVVALFGPTDPARTGPYGRGHAVMTSGASCAPCFKRDCDTIKCLGDIGVDEVLRTVVKIMEG
jgi:heptosyltransferase-1